MTHKNCLPFQAEIEEAASANRLIGASAREHLSDCAACAETFGEHARLRELISGLESVTAPADFEFRLRARMAGGAPRRATGFGWRWNPWGAPALGLVSALVLVVGGVTAVNTGIFQLGPADGVIGAVVNLPADNSLLDWTISAMNPVPDPSENESGSASRPRVIVPRRAAAESGGGVSEPAVRTASAPVLPQGFDADSAIDGNEFAVPVQTSNPTARILVDERGRTRNVALRPVSFGSQDLVMDPAVSRNVPPASPRIW